MKNNLPTKEKTAEQLPHLLSKKAILIIAIASALFVVAIILINLQCLFGIFERGV